MEDAEGIELLLVDAADALDALKVIALVLARRCETLRPGTDGVGFLLRRRILRHAKNFIRVGCHTHAQVIILSSL